MTPTKKTLHSRKLHLVFTRYSVIAGLSFLIDVLLFAVLYYVMQETFFPLLIARVLSAIFNFYQNKYVVYRSMDRSLIKRELWHYAWLALSVFCVSYVVILFLTEHLAWPTIPVKIGIDFLLFFLNFAIQYAVFSRGV